MSIKERLYGPAIPIALSVTILVVMGVIIARDTKALMRRDQDLPPTIEFTWSPPGRVSLKDMKAYLTIKDDYGLDFTTYRMTLVELDKTIDLPIPGLIGKDYEQPISFSLLADDPKVQDLGQLTVQISIADDRGQKSSLTRVIDLQH